MFPVAEDASGRSVGLFVLGRGRASAILFRMSDEGSNEAARGASVEQRHAEHLRLARRLESHPANRNGSDKTWVLASMRRMERLFRGAAPKEDPPGGARGPVR